MLKRVYCKNCGVAFTKDNSYTRIMLGKEYYDSYCRCCKIKIISENYRNNKKKKVGGKRKKKSV